MADPSAVAATTATAATTVSQQATQAALVSLLADPIDNAFQLLDPAQPSSWDTFIAAITALIHHFGLVSGAQAANYYESERKAAGIPGRFTVSVAPTAPADKIDTGMRWATKDLWQPNPDLQSVLSLVTGVAEKDILDTGRDTILGAVQSDRKSKGWARETEPGCCSFCAMLAVRGAVYRSAASADFQAHSNCVPGDTLVNGPSTEVAYKRWYEGEMVVIRLVGGEELSITPNHPVLTARGWVEAGLLVESDQIVQRSGADLALLNVPHEHDVPSRIEDVWGSHSVGGLRRMPVASEDFHGDVGVEQSEVEIVWSDRFLSEIMYAALRQLDCGPLVSGTAAWASIAAQFSAFGALGRMFSRSRNPSRRVMGSPSQFCSAHRAEFRHAQLVGITASSGFDPGGKQPMAHSSSRNAESFSDLLFGNSRAVDLDGFGREGQPIPRRADGPGTRYDPASAQRESKGLGVHLNLGRSLLERLAGGVQLSRLSNLRRIDYSGHVFNLQTAEGWYDANSLVVSNCRCFAQPIFTSYQPSAQVRGWQSLYQSSTQGVRGGAAMRNAFRKAYEAQQSQ